MAALLAALLPVADSLASAGGRSGFAGDPAVNSGAVCSVCHAPDGAPAPAIGIVGPGHLDAGASNNFYVVMLGGPAVTGGINIAASGGLGTLEPFDSDLELLDGELTHSAPKAFSDDLVAFVFRYRAPNHDAQVTLYAAGNSSDGGLDLLGDGIAHTAHEIEVRNGFEPPPPPPPPAMGELRATPFASGLNQPTAIAHAGDARLFVSERRGSIRIVRPDGTVEPTPFLDISAQVDDSGIEMGLLGLAFHPDFAHNGYFYLHYTDTFGDPATIRSRVARYAVSDDPALADPASETILLEFTQPFANHNGGDLHFGPQGYLYIASGDGGSGGDPQNNAQNTGNLLGKILRIDVDTPPGRGDGPDCDISGNARYRIPPGNAFVDGAGGAGCDEIFVLGARNPWRFSFDRETGGLWIADVGQNQYEEVNYLPPGTTGGINLGWRCFEGNEPFNQVGCDRDYLSPVHTYSHVSGACSVTGGRVYRGTRWPPLQGQYFFADFCVPSIRALSGSPGNPDHRVVLPVGDIASPSAFGEDAAGELYVASLFAGTIHRLDPVLPPGC